jgi:hypothetical protein
MLPLTSTLRQKQTQFESSSSNRSDVTSKLSRHCGHSLPPLREFDQQLGLLLGPFAGFCRPHCCARSEDRMLHQLEPQFGRDEGALHFAMRPLCVPPSAEHTITKTVLLNSSGCNCLIRTTTGTLASSGCRVKSHADKSENAISPLWTATNL